MSNVPSNFIPIQQESIQFNNPTSESSLTAIGGLCNGLLSVALPVGSIVHSTLTEVQFQSQIGNPSPVTWILADGRDITGSDLQLLTSQTNAPDLRGIFVRGKNNGRSDGNQNPDGELPIGTYTADGVGTHTHTVPQAFYPGVGKSGSDSPNVFAANQDVQSDNANPVRGDTAPKNVTVNIFIRIN